jgi:2-dehydro-3-deoxygalactonokinase
MSETAVFTFHWGNTALTGWALGSNGDILETFAAPEPLEKGRSEGFETVFEHAAGDFVATQKSAPLIFAGMVGAVNGWKPAVYSDCPITPEKLHAQAERFAFHGHQCAILPGATCRDSHGNADVMRGEEVQLLAASQLLGQNNLTVSIPGRHCKHAKLENGALTRFRSFITGELFDLLLGQSLVGALAEGTSFSEAAFRKGVHHGAAHPVTTAVFASRANALNGTLEKQDIASFLSGVLIGNEASHLRDQGEIALMASGLLADRHALAYDTLGIAYQQLDSKKCMQVGLQMIARHMMETV